MLALAPALVMSAIAGAGCEPARCVGTSFPEASSKSQAVVTTGICHSRARSHFWPSPESQMRCVHLRENAGT